MAVTDAQKEEIIRLRKRGYSLATIMRNVECSYDDVRYVIRESGIVSDMLPKLRVIHALDMELMQRNNPLHAEDFCKKDGR